MTDRDLRKLGRPELIELLIGQMQENDAIKARLSTAEKALEERTIQIKNAGTLAEAAMSLNGVFASADAAAKQYLDNIRELSERQELLCTRMEAETRKKCNEMLEKTERACANREAAMRKQFEEIRKSLRVLSEMRAEVFAEPEARPESITGSEGGNGEIVSAGSEGGNGKRVSAGPGDGSREKGSGNRPEEWKA